MKKLLFFSLFSGMFLNVISAQTTSVPDETFENYLETHDADGNEVSVGAANSMGNGTDGDGLVLTNRINTVKTLKIDSWDYEVESFTGLEDFTDLEELELLDSYVTEFDVTSNTKLKKLIFTGNWDVTSIDLTNNTMLTYLSLDGTDQIPTLDLSSNSGLIHLDIGYTTAWFSNRDVPNLEYLNVNFTEQTAIDLSELPKLKTFIAEDAIELTSINLSNLTNLEKIVITDHKLASIDLSDVVNLKELILNYYSSDFCWACSPKTLKSLDVSNNTKLEKLELQYSESVTTYDLSNNTMLKTLDLLGATGTTTVDLSNCVNLEYLDLYNNTNLTGDFDFQNMPNLTIIDFANCNINSLNLKNGNNTNIGYLWVSGNANLSCISVDDETYSTNNWVGDQATQGSFAVDAGQSFSENCSLSVNSFDNLSFDVYPNPTSGVVKIQSEETINKISIYNVIGKEVMSIKNTEKNIDISDLNSGIYFVKIFSENKSGVKKLVKN